MLQAQLYEGLTDEYVQIDTAAGYANAVPDLYWRSFRWAQWHGAGVCTVVLSISEPIFFSDKLALRMYNAQPVTREQLRGLSAVGAG